MPATKQLEETGELVFGSANLAARLLKKGLIDEVRVMINPVVLGAGISLFKAPLKLRHQATRSFDNGNVLVTYTLANS